MVRSVPGLSSKGWHSGFGQGVAHGEAELCVVGLGAADGVGGGGVLTV